jgi:hypothetical protein
MESFNHGTNLTNPDRAKVTHPTNRSVVDHSIKVCDICGGVGELADACFPAAINQVPAQFRPSWR